MHDIMIIGGGPGGLSAAINARARNKTVLVVTNPFQENPLYKAEKVNNYLGLPHRTGQELLEGFIRHAQEVGAEFHLGRALNILPAGQSFFLSMGSEVEEARAVILATGVVRGRKYPGEAQLLGAGVSYCATCDGMLYRGKKVAVIGLSPEAREEADFLRSLNCEVLYFEKPGAYEIKGTDKVESLVADGVEHQVEGVFILRPTLAPTDLLPGLTTEGGYVVVDRHMRTNIPGVFAAGDCTGAPIQISKAVGEGLIAGQKAAEFVK